MAKISILIANFNNGHLFEDAYRSLVSQTSDQWEAIVIDDASADDSVAVIEKLIRGDKRFLFFKNETNIGCQKTVLRAIELSSTEIFGRLDPDDALYPDAVEISLIEHQKHPEVGLVYSDITFCDKDLNPQAVYAAGQVDHLDEKSLLLNGEIGGFATLKKEFYDKTSGIDSTILRAEDIDIYMKMCEVAPVKRIPKSVYYYRILNTSLSKGQNAERAYFWHLVSIVKLAERRQKNLEDLFNEHFVKRRVLNAFKQRRENLLTAVNQNRLLVILAYLAGKKF